MQKAVRRAAVFIADSIHERDIYHKTDSTAIRYQKNNYNKY